MKTRRNGKELNDELQLYKQRKNHLIFVRPYNFKYTNSLKSI